MAKALIQLTKTQAPTPTGVTFASTQVVVTDASGAAQNFTLTGTESPAWSVTTADLADGSATITATDVDTTGAAIGTPISTTFTSGGGSTATFPQTASITVSAA